MKDIPNKKEFQRSIMKTSKISKILGVGLTIAMLTSLLAVATPASAGTLSWGAELGLPSATTSTAVNQLAVASDVNDIAVSTDGGTIYAVSSGPTEKSVLKSTNGGTSWSRLTVTALTTPALIATAPGDANIILVVGDTTEAYLSTNGGTTFTTDMLPPAMTSINAIAISPSSSGVRYITLAGTIGGASAIQYLDLGATIPAWTPITSGTWDVTPSATATSFTGTTDVRAIAYSPNFASDKILVALTEVGTTNATFEIASFVRRVVITPGSVFLFQFNTEITRGKS